MGIGGGQFSPHHCSLLENGVTLTLKRIFSLPLLMPERVDTKLSA